MRRKETTDLIEAIEKSANSQSLPVNSVMGRNGGTFVCKQLVYAYAMWISPAFSLKVIDAFDAMVTKPQQPAALVFDLSNQLQQFQFDTTAVRVVTLDSAPWFIAKDVCDVLGIANPSQAVAALDADEFSTFNIGKGRPPLVVNESGVIGLVMQSRKPEARRFQKWVRSVVIPAIAKDGAYVMGEEKVATGEMSEDELVLLAMQAQQRKVERMRLELEQKNRVIEK